MAKTTTKGTHNKLIALIIGLSLAVFGAIFVNWFVYPFTSATPNYADVEAVYNKLQIPSDWQKIAEGSNKGLAGRQCPIESATMCFHKSAEYSTPNLSPADVKAVFKNVCVSQEYKDETYSGDVPNSKFSLRCYGDRGIKAVITGDVANKLVYVSTSSR